MTVQLSRGSRLGDFELLSLLGRGGMATVWVARQTSASGRQRLLALKAMLPELAAIPSFRSMFLGEGQIVRSIEHPNVVRVFDVGEDQGILYMAMEWIEGDSLRVLYKEARERGPVPAAMAVRIVADAAAGLHAAHELRGWDGELRGIVHCDVSPHNILINLQGQAKIVDFGVAHAAARTSGEPSDEVKGKFGYMSPEQARGEAVDRRTDVFALGIVLFELTTGERLFKGRDPVHTLQLVSAGTVPLPTTIVPEYPPKLEAVLLRSLAPDPKNRFQSAQEFQQALEKFLVESGTMVTTAGVGQLMQRALGPSIDARREEIRQALRDIDELGAARVSLPPPMSHPKASALAPAVATHSVLAPNSSVTHTPSATTQSAALQPPPVVQQVVLVAPPRAGTPGWAILLAVLILAGGVVGVLQVFRPSLLPWYVAPVQPGAMVDGGNENQVGAPPTNGPGAAAPSAAPLPSDGISLDELPAQAAQRRRRGGAEEVAPPPPSSPAPEAAPAPSVAPPPPPPPPPNPDADVPPPPDHIPVDPDFGGH